MVMSIFHRASIPLEENCFNGDPERYYLKIKELERNYNFKEHMYETYVR